MSRGEAEEENVAGGDELEVVLPLLLMTGDDVVTTTVEAAANSSCSVVCGEDSFVPPLPLLPTPNAVVGEKGVDVKRRN